MPKRIVRSGVTTIEEGGEIRALAQRLEHPEAERMRIASEVPRPISDDVLDVDPTAAVRFREGLSNGSEPARAARGR